MSRLILIRHGPTSASVAHAFPTDERLTPHGRRAATGLQDSLPAAASVLSSPARRCLETAASAGLEAEVDPGLAECDFGTWAGSTLAEVHSRDPEGVTAWMSDPAAIPHGGESLIDLLSRVGCWLAEDRPGITIAFTHGGFIRAAIAHTRQAPPEAVWQIPVAPLAVTELARTRDGWQALTAPVDSTG